MSKHFWMVMADGSGCRERIKAKDVSDALEQAEQWALDGEWGDNTETFWIDVRVEDLKGDVLDCATVTFDPEEPDCCNDLGHEWSDDYKVVGGCRSSPGVFGHGGGVILKEFCVHCGCGKTTDTWAQRPDTGEQGLTSISYEPGEFSPREGGSENEAGF